MRDYTFAIFCILCAIIAIGSCVYDCTLFNRCIAELTEAGKNFYEATAICNGATR